MQSGNDCEPFVSFQCIHDMYLYQYISLCHVSLKNLNLNLHGSSLKSSMADTWQIKLLSRPDLGKVIRVSCFEQIENRMEDGLVRLHILNVHLRCRGFHQMIIAEVESTRKLFPFYPRILEAGV